MACGALLLIRLLEADPSSTPAQTYALGPMMRGALVSLGGKRPQLVTLAKDVSTTA